MSVFNYKKYKVSLKADSKKTQGLRTGDIVRRQYFDGKNQVYSLMCVLDYGVDKVVVGDEIEEQAFFIGALLEGDAPQTNEILDFMRVTSLFDVNRSGALYLTASDEQSPFMDVIDGIGRNFSLCWPEGIGNTEYTDSQSQYIIKGEDYVSVEYINSDLEHNRICHITRGAAVYSDFIGLQQDFYQYVANPNRVLISYKIKSNRELRGIKCSLGYADGERVDGEVIVSSATEWQYKLHAITVDWSGRHLRTMKLNVNDNLSEGDEIWIADMNIILQSNVSSYKDASQIRIGKMDGINDPVFGNLAGYGGYMQKLYASQSAHISGTLTAGDENGFGSTFYAGKIHKNAFQNSLSVNFTSDVLLNDSLTNPTGIGNVYSFENEITLIAQSNEWLKQKVGEKYCFSFWSFVEKPCTISFSQNGQLVKKILFGEENTYKWSRQSVVFEILSPLKDNEPLLFSFLPHFAEEQELVSGVSTIHFTAPQLEQGTVTTQYQPTDDTLNMTEDYGAWFNKGGIGGTIQNPLLQLNYDGKGGVGTRTKSILIRQDGSGYLANRNIEWGEDGKVKFSEDVTLNWENISDDAKEQMKEKSVSISGTDTFMILGDLSPDTYYCYPSIIKLLGNEINIPKEAKRKWYYQYGGDFYLFEGENADSITILPNGEYWKKENVLTVKYEVTVNQEVYYNTISIKKQYCVGYTVELDSTHGKSFKNGVCSTVIRANVYYQGKLVQQDFLDDNFTFQWEKYRLPDTETPLAGWWEEIVDPKGNIIQNAIDITKQSIELNYNISGSDLYTCTLIAKENNAFPYPFPIVFS